MIPLSALEELAVELGLMPPRRRQLPEVSGRFEGRQKQSFEAGPSLQHRLPSGTPHWYGTDPNWTENLDRPEVPKPYGTGRTRADEPDEYFGPSVGLGWDGTQHWGRYPRSV